MQIDTVRFGTIEIADDDILTFPEGLPGFEAFHHFTVVAHQSPLRTSASPFQWIQSTEKPELAFLSVEPYHFFADYEPSISKNDLDGVGIENPADVQVMTLLTVPPNDPRGITANLLAPIVINRSNRFAKQVIINSDRYGLRHRLVAESYAQNTVVSGGGSDATQIGETAPARRERLPA